MSVLKINIEMPTFVYNLNAPVVVAHQHSHRQNIRLYRQCLLLPYVGTNVGMNWGHYDSEASLVPSDLPAEIKYAFL